MRIKMPSFKSVTNGTALTDFSKLSESLDMLKMANDKLQGVRSSVEKSGLDIPQIPKINMPDFGIKKCISNTTNEIMDTTFNKMNSEMKKIDMTDISNVEKETGIKLDLGDINTDLTKVSFD